MNIQAKNSYQKFRKILKTTSSNCGIKSKRKTMFGQKKQRGQKRQIDPIENTEHDLITFNATKGNLN